MGSVIMRSSSAAREALGSSGLAVLGLRGRRWLSLATLSGLLCTCSARASVAVASLAVEHRLGARRRQKLWPAGSRALAQYLWHLGLVALWHVGSSQTRDRTSVSCTARHILNHWTTREGLKRFSVCPSGFSFIDKRFIPCSHFCSFSFTHFSGARLPCREWTNQRKIPALRSLTV